MSIYWVSVQNPLCLYLLKASTEGCMGQRTGKDWAFYFHTTSSNLKPFWITAITNGPLSLHSLSITFSCQQCLVSGIHGSEREPVHLPQSWMCFCVWLSQSFGLLLIASLLVPLHWFTLLHAIASTKKYSMAPLLRGSQYLGVQNKNKITYVG